MLLSFYLLFKLAPVIILELTPITKTTNKDSVADILIDILTKMTDK